MSTRKLIGVCILIAIALAFGDRYNVRWVGDAVQCYILLVLAIITARYAHHTGRLARYAEQNISLSRQDLEIRRRPSLWLRIWKDPSKEGRKLYRLINVGGFPAVDIKVNLKGFESVPIDFLSPDRPEHWQPVNDAWIPKVRHELEIEYRDIDHMYQYKWDYEVKMGGDGEIYCHCKKPPEITDLGTGKLLS